MIRHFKDGTPKNTFCLSNLVFRKLNQKNSQQAGLQLSFSESCICPWKLMKQTKCWTFTGWVWSNDAIMKGNINHFQSFRVQSSNNHTQTHNPARTHQNQLIKIRANWLWINAGIVNLKSRNAFPASRSPWNRKWADRSNVISLSLAWIGTNHGLVAPVQSDFSRT